VFSRTRVPHTGLVTHAEERDYSDAACCRSCAEVRLDRRGELGMALWANWCEAVAVDARIILWTQAFESLP